MKRIVCELCEGTEFTKNDGFFICQGCGTRYSLEEAKNMMREVEGEPEPFVNAPTMTQPVGNPNQGQIDNILVLATTAYEAQNYAEAENYCNKAIELDSTCYNAWNLKGKAIGWSSTLGRNRVQEASYSFNKAIEFAPVDKERDMKKEALDEIGKFGLAMISLRKDNFKNNPGSAELNGFKDDLKTLLDSTKVISRAGKGAELPVEYVNQMADLMYEAANGGHYKVLGSAMAAAQALISGNRSVQFLGPEALYNCYSLLCDAILICNDENKIQKYYKTLKEWHDTTLTKTSTEERVKRQYREMMSKVNAHLETVRNQKENARRAQIEAYWETHAAEKAALDAEKVQLTKKKDELNKQIGKLTDEIDYINAEEKAKVPSEAETDELKGQIRVLERRRASLGIFSGKEKKQITEEIATLQGRIDSLKDKIPNEKNVKAEDIRNKREPLQKKKNDLVLQRDATSNRISVIEDKLTKVPG